MQVDIVHVEHLGRHRLKLRSEDGTTGVVHVAQLVRSTGVFESLGDLGYFARVRVDPDLGTVCWPNGADLDPDVLYAEITDGAVDLSDPMGVRRP